MAGYALGMFGLAAVFAVGAVFPEMGWGWIRLWAKNDSEIRPTRTYLVYRRVTGAIVAVLCLVAGVAVVAVDVTRNRRTNRCEQTVDAIMDSYDAGGFISDERADLLAEDLEVEITVTLGIASGDAYDMVEVHDSDFDATLFPDSQPQEVCERVAA